jgi:hypothetical protein
MRQRRLFNRTTVKAAGTMVVAGVALALLFAACGPGPTNGEPPPTGDISITVTVIGDGRATFESNGFTCSATCTLMIDSGADVSLTAVPDAERELVAWDGPCGPFDDACTWQADEGISVTVTFAPHALRFDLQGDGEGSFEIDAAGVVTVCREACGVPLQQPLLVTIQYVSGGPARTTLDPWIGCDDVDEAGTYCLVNVEGATTVGKTWRLWPHLTLIRDGSGNVTSDPGTIDLDAGRMSADFAHGTMITLTADPDDGNDFAGWTGIDCQGGGNDDLECLFVIEENETVTATFSASTHTLDVDRDGSGMGNVTSSPSGIDLDAGDVSATFVHGTEITLTALAAPGTNFFIEWRTGPCAGSTSTTCTFTITDDTAVDATFSRRRPRISDGASDTGDVTRRADGVDRDEARPAASSTRPPPSHVLRPLMS